MKCTFVQFFFKYTFLGLQLVLKMSFCEKLGFEYNCKNRKHPDQNHCRVVCMRYLCVGVRKCLRVLCVADLSPQPQPVGICMPPPPHPLQS